MELRIIETNENKLTERTELTGHLSFTGATPSQKEVIGAISSKLKVKSETVVIKMIDTKFGFMEADVSAYVYGSVNSKEKYEPRLGKKAVEKIEKQKKAEVETKKKAEEEAKKKAEEEAKKKAEEAAAKAESAEAPEAAEPVESETKEE